MKAPIQASTSRGRPRAAPPATPFARAIRQYREALGLTQAEVATFCRVGIRTMQRWESGEISPRGNQIVALAAVLEVPDLLLLNLA